MDRNDLEDLERCVINALHRENAAETLRLWIGGAGMPEGLLDTLLNRFQTDAATVLLLVLQSERRLACQPAPIQFWAQRTLEAIPRTTILELAHVQVASHLRQHIRGYERGLRLVLDPDRSLSPDGLALLGLFLREYLSSGYLNSGNTSPGVAARQLEWEDLDRFWSSLEELVAASLVQRRDCQAIAYELTPAVRASLIAQFGLRHAWYETSPLFQVDQISEVEAVEQEVRRLSSPGDRETSS